MVEKKTKFTFKLFLLIIEAVALVVSVGSSIYFGTTISTKARYDAEYQDKVSFYNDNGFDLLVSGASTDQVNEMKQQSSITHATAASKISLNVKTPAAEDYRDIIVLDSQDDFAYTEFTSERIINETTATDFVYADYKFCTLYCVKLGDSISITVGGTAKEYVISRVYRTDYLYNEGILITTKDQINLTSKAQNVYLNANNKDNLVSYLQDYKPLGTLLAQTSSQSDSDYQKYLDEFYSKKYYASYVTDLSGAKETLANDYSKKLSSANTSFYISVAVVSTLCLVASLVCFFVNARNKEDKIYKYIQENGSKRIVEIFSAFNASFALFMIVGSLIVMGSSLNGLTAYFTFSSVLVASWMTLVLPVVAILVGYAITLIKIKKA